MEATWPNRSSDHGTSHGILVPPLPHSGDKILLRKGREGRNTWEDRNRMQSGQFSYQPAGLCNNEKLYFASGTKLSVLGK